MRRLCVFSFYDADGVVDSYIEYLLNNLIENVSDLFIAVNGNLSVEGERKLKKFSDNIIIRENRGFDAGAYFDVLVKIIGKERLKVWDEILLCNDTFYGPFRPFADIFKEMSLKQNDFWGLSYADINIMECIQSYFLVFRKKIIEDGELFEYFNAYVDAETESLSDVYAFFEVGLFHFLCDRGYQFDVYTDVQNCNIYSSAGFCIEKFGLPILKKRAFNFRLYDKEEQINTLKYLAHETDYNVEYILESIKRKYGIDIKLADIVNSEYKKREKRGVKNAVSTIGSQKLIDFCVKNKSVYIYGAGAYAKRIWWLYHKYMKKFNGFIISNNQEMAQKYLFGFPVKYYRDVEPGIAIVVAMDVENSQNVEKYLKAEDQILFIW